MNRFRLIQEGEIFDIATIYYSKGRPVAFHRYRPQIHPDTRSSIFKDSLQEIQHITASALKYRALNVIRLNLKEV